MLNYRRVDQQNMRSRLRFLYVDDTDPKLNADLRCGQPYCNLVRFKRIRQVLYPGLEINVKAFNLTTWFSQRSVAEELLPFELN